MKKGKEKIKRGISLIVLVITIIVIIILATAIILTLNKNNPIEEANNARYESDVANIQAIFTNTVAKVMAQNQSTIKINAGSINTVKTVDNGETSVDGTVNYELEAPQKQSNKNGTIVFDTGENTETVYYTGRKLPLYKTGETTWYVDSEGIITLEIDKKTYGSGTKTEGNAGDPVTPEEPVYEEVEVGQKVTGSVKQYTDSKGNTAIIPIDFAVVPEKDDVENGLVISDVSNDTEDIGNQFVWIPVENMETFVREDGYQRGQNGELILQNTLSKEYYTEPLNYNGVIASMSEQQEYENMLSSIKEYKGFYIGRYETSNNGEDKAQSKKGVLPWTNIKFANSMTDLSGGIVEKIRGMYPEINAKKGNAVSTVVYGICWDEIVRFIRKNYPDVEKNAQNYGNILGTNGNVAIPTGSKEEYSQNNIYDMTGNIYEKTMEVYSYEAPVVRGGYCSSDSWCLSTRVQRTITS